MTSIDLSRPDRLRLPDAATLVRLFVGGAAGLAVWELWARGLTPLVLGGPLEPAGLVISLARRFTGYDLPRLPAEVIHYAIGIIGYPIAYFAVSRWLPRWGLVLDLAVWAIFTAFALVLVATGGLTASVSIFWLIVTAVTATRALNPSLPLPAFISLEIFTVFNALGIMAPLAGLPFLLMEWGGGLSFMSYVGHVIYGFVAALVFERLNRA